MLVSVVPYETILPIWRDKLWPGRTSPIEPFSAMTLDRDYDMAFAETDRWFLAGYEDGEIVAVNSVHIAGENACGDLMARSRGLWVDPKCRGKGYGAKILHRSCEVAAMYGAAIVWSFPRKTSWKTYERVGFQQLSDWLEDGEFGPNCYAAKRVDGI